MNKFSLSTYTSKRHLRRSDMRSFVKIWTSVKVQHWLKERKSPEESEESVGGTVLSNLILSDLEKGVTNEVNKSADGTKVF